MRQVLRSWASVCVGGARLGPNERVLSDDEWRAMRASETKATRVRRRQHEAISRLINFGKIVFTKDKRRAQLRAKFQVAVRRVQRQIRARSRWRSAGGRVVHLVHTALQRRDSSARRAGARMSTMVATVASLLQGKAKARRKLIASEPMRPRLLNAAAVGPVALDVIVSYESLGYG